VERSALRRSPDFQAPVQAIPLVLTGRGNIRIGSRQILRDCSWLKGRHPGVLWGLPRHTL